MNTSREGLDKAIEELSKILKNRNFTGDEFEAKWQDLLAEIVNGYPNISAGSLIDLEMPLGANRMYLETLMVSRLAAELLPNSSECQVFLGHAYNNIGDLVLAAQCYEKAYDLAMRKIQEKQLTKNDAIYLDASDYLRHLANTENSLLRHVDAFLHAVKALSMVREAKAKFKYPPIYKVLHRICEGMHLINLAEEYRLLSVEPEREVVGE